MPQPRSHWNRLAARVAIVTGAGTHDGVGVGVAIARLFASEGAHVCVVDRDHGRAIATAEIIEADGGTAISVRGDMRIADDCTRVVTETMEAYGKVDILVNNVGVSGSAGTLANLDLDRWSDMIDVNLKSAVMMCRDCVPHMIAAGGGAIVNIGSIAGMRAHGGSLSYGPSKAALVQLTREIAVMHGADGIRANTVAPGHIFTPHVATLLDPDARLTRRAVAPLNIEGDAWDIAQAVLFLASEEARFVTGQLLTVDGGATQIGPLAAYANIRTASERAPKPETTSEIQS